MGAKILFHYIEGPHMMTLMNPPTYIRKVVFGMTQVAFAEALGVRQPTVSNWENTGRISSRFAPLIRSLAMDTGRPWSDSWFFETPED